MATLDGGLAKDTVNRIRHGHGRNPPPAGIDHEPAMYPRARPTLTRSGGHLCRRSGTRLGGPSKRISAPPLSPGHPTRLKRRDRPASLPWGKIPSNREPKRHSDETREDAAREGGRRP
jgi:hypothetical protein